MSTKSDSDTEAELNRHESPARQRMAYSELDTDGDHDEVDVPHKKHGRCCDMALCRCLRRVPYATLVACLLLAGGLALMTYEIIKLLETADNLFDGTVLMDSSSPYFKGLNLAFWLLIALVVLISLFGISFLIMACFTAGPSKKNTCGQRFVRCISRISISVVIIFAYFLCIAWIVASIVFAMPLTFMLMSQSFCNSHDGKYPPEACLNLAQYGMAPAVTAADPDSGTAAPLRTDICGTDLANFCEKHDNIQLDVWLTITASIIVVISMIHFLMALAANHTYTRLFHKDLPSSPKYSNNFGSPGLAESPIY